MLQLTEYFAESKAGFLRSKLTATYKFVEEKDEEYVFSGHLLTFRCAFYPNPDLAYGMAFDSNKNNYLVKFDWNA